MLPMVGMFGHVTEWLKMTDDAQTFAGYMERYARTYYGGGSAQAFVSGCYEALDAMVQDEWVRRGRDKKKPMLRLSHNESRTIRSNADEKEILAGAKGAVKIVDRIGGNGVTNADGSLADN